MTRVLIYLLLFGTVLYLLSTFGKKKNVENDAKDSGGKSNRWFRGKRNPREIWVQVYETATLEEGRLMQARLQEEEVECILYEQGKKDIHGNELAGIGVAVPKSSAPHAQGVISRMPV